MTVAATIVLALIPRLRGQTARDARCAALAAAFALVWTGTAEVYAAHGESLFSERLYNSLPSPRTGSIGRRRPIVVFLGQGVRDPNPVNLLEFWNRSLTKVWSLDGTAPGPEATTTPDLDKPDGTLTTPARATSC